MTELKMIADLLTEPPPAEKAVARGRARLTTVMTAAPAIRRGRRRLAAGITAAAAAAAVVLGLGLSGAAGSATARGTGTIRTAAFTLTKNANGTATLSLTPQVLLDPAALQRDLRQDGIPAIVTSGSFCSSDPIPSGFTQVVSGPNPNGTPPPTYTINPAAMPAGTELSFGIEQIPNPAGYANRPLRTQSFMELIDTNSYTCPSALPEPWPQLLLDGEGASVEYLPGGGWVLLYPAGS